MYLNVKIIQCIDQVTMNDTGSNETWLFDEGLVSLELYTFQMIWHPIVFSVCIPLNLFVGYVLLFDKELHNARNAIWLDIVPKCGKYILKLRTKNKTVLRCLIVFISLVKCYKKRGRTGNKSWFLQIRFTSFLLPFYFWHLAMTTSNGIWGSSDQCHLVARIPILFHKKF